MHTSDDYKVIVNDMTKIFKPEQTEYSYQFTEVPAVPAMEISVKDILDGSSCCKGTRRLVCLKGFFSNNMTDVQVAELLLADNITLIYDAESHAMAVVKD